MNNVLVAIFKMAESTNSKYKVRLPQIKKWRPLKMADFKLRLALIQKSTRRQAVWSYTAPFCLALLGNPPYLFTDYVI